MKGVLGDGLVRVDWTQTVKGHNLIVSGVAGSIFYHIELKELTGKMCKIKPTNINIKKNGHVDLNHFQNSRF